MKALLYCTKAKPIIVKASSGVDDNFSYCDIECYPPCYQHAINGKIVAECEIETEIINSYSTMDSDGELDYWHTTKTMREYELLKRSCLTYRELDEYLKERDGYAIYIKNLKIFDKPMELKDVIAVSNPSMHLTRAPQNMCKVADVDEEGVVWKVLISIRPEWICEILNGEKTIEVRKQVLNCMKEDIK